MRKISYFLSFAIIIIMFTSCSKSLYPGQKESGRKEVPSITGYFTQVPIVQQVGDLKWIHDSKNNAFILFKGANDTLLSKMIDHLSKSTDENGDIATTLVKFTETPIAPLTLFTKKELKRQSKMDQQRIVELAKYKTYAVTLASFTYVEDLDEDEFAKFQGKKYTPVTTVKQPTQQPKVKKENDELPATRNGRPVRYRGTKRTGGSGLGDL